MKQVLVHVSSAYVNSNRDAADEIIYDIPQKPDEAINLVKGLSDEALEELEPKLVGNSWGGGGGNFPFVLLLSSTVPFLKKKF